MVDHNAEKALTPAQVVSMEYEGYMHSDTLDPAWIAGWHAAINWASFVLARAAKNPAVPPASTPEEGTR